MFGRWEMKGWIEFCRYAWRRHSSCRFPPSCIQVVIAESSCLDFFHLSFVETIWGFVQVCVYTSPLVCNTIFSSNFMGAGYIYHSRHGVDSATGHYKAAWMDFGCVLQNQQHCKRWDFGSKTSLSSLWGICGENSLRSGRICVNLSA